MPGRVAIAACHYRRVIFANVLIAALTLKAMTTRSCPVENDMVASGKSCHRFAESFNSTSAFMTHHDGFPPPHRVVIGMTQTRSLHSDDYFIVVRFADLKVINEETTVAVG
jgi:hypothetical protein